MRIKADDIIIWIIIALIISLAIWKLVGSPTDTASLIALALFAAGSIIMIWRHIFAMKGELIYRMHNLDKKTAVSFMKIKHDMDKNTLTLRNDLEKNTLSLRNDIKDLGRKGKR